MIDHLNSHFALKRNKYVVLIDELFFSDNQFDLKPIIQKCKEVDIDLNIAISPISSYSTVEYHLLYDEDELFAIQRLTYKHRNSIEIGTLLSHLKLFLTDQSKTSMSPISDDGDASLKESSFSTGQLPLWINASSTISDEYVLEEILKNHILPQTDVTLLYNEHVISFQRIEKLNAWCERRNWLCLDSVEMTGSEAPVVVLFDVGRAELETYSRAQKQLIVVTR